MNCPICRKAYHDKDDYIRNHSMPGGCLNHLKEVNAQLLEACEMARDDIINLTDEIQAYHPDYLDTAIATAKGNEG